jgi:fermentation-respiration switch protein FrsA (DUF1100 family)
VPLTDNYIFDLDENVTRKPVSYQNRFGITISADLYRPRNLDESEEHAAIIVGAPYGGVKEGPGIYARYHSEDAYERAANPKELYVVPNAGHVDLYDKTDLIPFEKLEEFFTENLASPSSEAVGELVGSKS